jgi:hypothetical protein
MIKTSCFRKSYFGLQVRGVGRDQTDVQDQAESQLHSEPEAGVLVRKLSQLTPLS